MEMKIPAIVIAAFIVITVLAGVLMPVLGDATAKTDTFINEGPRMSPLGENTITITYSNDDWKINDRDLGFGSFPITQGTIMIFGQTGASRAGFFYQSENDNYTRSNVNRSGEYTWVYDGSAKTVDVIAVVSGTTYTSSHTYIGEIYYNDPNGEYAWFGEKPANAYIPEDWSKFNAWSIEATHFYAIIGDTITVDGEVVTEGVSTTLVLEDVPDHVGIKNISSYTLDIEGQDPISCRGYILPYKVTAERAVHFTDSQNAIFAAIPVMVIIALLIGVVALVLRNRQ